MDKCIDLFSRLLIATITFVVPILINLLSSFSEGEKRRKELSKLTEESLTKQAAEEIQANPAFRKQTIHKTHNELERNEKITNSEIELLDPIAQFWRIFTALIVSFIFLIINYLIRENWKQIYNHNFSVVTLIVSIFSYLVSLFFIIRILYTVSKTKRLV